MIVVIVAVLMGVAIATYLFAVETTGETAAHARTKQALVAQEAYFIEAQRYGAADDVRPMESAVEFADFDSARGAEVLGRVYVKDPTGASVELVVRDNSGDCYWTRQVNGAPLYAVGGCVTPPPENAFTSRWP